MRPPWGDADADTAVGTTRLGSHVSALRTTPLATDRAETVTGGLQVLKVFPRGSFGSLAQRSARAEHYQRLPRPQRIGRPMHQGFTLRQALQLRVGLANCHQRRWAAAHLHRRTEHHREWRTGGVD